GRDRRRMLACRSCQGRFSERKGTAFCGSRLRPEQAHAVFQHLQDGCGVRQTARLTGVDKDTFVRYALRAGPHAQARPEELPTFCRSTQEAQRDEKWSFVFQKQQHCDPDDPADARCGACWDSSALDPEHRLVVSAVVGKRTEANACQLVLALSERSDGRALHLLTSDAYASYPTP